MNRLKVPTAERSQTGHNGLVEGLRILHVVPTYLPARRYGGPIYSVHGLCKALARNGHEVHVFTTDVDGRDNMRVPLDEPVNRDGVKVWYFQSGAGRRLYYSPAMKRSLALRVHEFDLLHLHSVFLWPTWAAARVASRANVPYIVSPRGMLHKELVQRKSRWKKSAWIHLIERRNLNNAAMIHATSRSEAGALQDFALALPPVVVVPNGVDVPRMGGGGDKAVSGDVADTVQSGEYVLYLGRINWKKGLDRLLETWGKSVGARLVIAGNDEEGYVDMLQRQIAARDDGNVTFVPRFVTGVDKEQLIENAAILVLPSYSENFGNVVLEAMARGVPVVVTEEVGAREIVRESQGGLVLPFREIGDAVKSLLADPARRKEMGQNGRDFVAEKLDWNTVARDMEPMYRQAIAAR